METRALVPVLMALVSVVGFPASGEPTVRPMAVLTGGFSFFDIAYDDRSTIDEGSMFGLELGALVQERYRVGIGYDYVNAEKNTIHNIIGGPDGQRLDIPLHLVRVFMEFHPRVHAIGSNPQGRARWSLGGGVGAGRGWTSGEYQIASVFLDLDETVSLSGSDWVLDGYIVADLWANDHIGLSPRVGYRFVEVGSIEATGSSGQGPSGSIDYSGFFVQVGIRYAL